MGNLLKLILIAAICYGIYDLVRERPRTELEVLEDRFAAALCGASEADLAAFDPEPIFSIERADLLAQHPSYLAAKSMLVSAGLDLAGMQRHRELISCDKDMNTAFAQAAAEKTRGLCPGRVIPDLERRLRCLGTVAQLEVFLSAVDDGSP